MKLWKITRTTPVREFDIYLAAIVAAKTEQDARHTHPGGTGKIWQDLGWLFVFEGYVDTESWVDPKDVTVTLVGTAVKGTAAGTVLCAEFIGG